MSSTPSGGKTLLLKGLWKRIGIDRCLSKTLKDRDFTTPVGDAIFAMVATVSWPKVRAELERLHLGKFLHTDGHILLYTEPTRSQRNILKKLKISIREGEVLQRHSLKTPNFVGTTSFFGIAVFLY